MTPEEAYGVVLKRYRTEAGLSQEALALEAGLERTFISMLERGIRRPTINTILVLANALDVDAGAMVNAAMPLVTTWERVKGRRS